MGDPKKQLQETQRPLAQKEPRRSGSGGFWKWLGLGKDGEKTGLDLLQALAAISVPVVVVIVGSIFTASQSRSQQEVEKQRAQEEALQAYLGGMESLVLNEDLHNAGSGEEVSALARARTLTALERLDPDRKVSVLQFLYESDLISGGNVVVNLYGADLSKADLEGAMLPKVNLGNLPSAIPAGARRGTTGGQRGSPERSTDLSEANLEGASLEGATLDFVNLDRTNLRDTNFKDAALRGMSLQGADLECTDLSNAEIMGDLSDANLSMANLSSADLRRSVTLTQGQIERAYGDENTQLPDGVQLPPSWNEDSDVPCRWTRSVFG